ncbi:MAG: hypothetical protein ACK4FJ_18475 [Ferrovibrio sp.]|uniref:hypothetical protein n=1 Tax=Ferrovibrio sp. TaxID=1917215 RepID=UPI00391AE1D1
MTVHENLYDRIAAITGVPREHVKRVALALSYSAEPPASRPRLFDPEQSSLVLHWASPEVPYGYDTVLGWLARNEPGILIHLEDPVEDTKRDGFWLCHRCREQGLNVIRVPAPPGLRQVGIEEVNAYPVELIRKRMRC